MWADFIKIIIITVFIFLSYDEPTFDFRQDGKLTATDHNFFIYLIHLTEEILEICLTGANLLNV